MAASVTLTDKQHVPAGITVLDEDGQPFASLPDGHTVSFVSSDESVAGVVAGADEMNIDITSGKVGTATVTATVSFPDGASKSDTLTVTVINSAPGSLNFTPGEPAAE